MSSEIYIVALWQYKRALWACNNHDFQSSKKHLEVCKNYLTINNIKETEESKEIFDRIKELEFALNKGHSIVYLEAYDLVEKLDFDQAFKIYFDLYEGVMTSFDINLSNLLVDLMAIQKQNISEEEKMHLYQMCCEDHGYVNIASSIEKRIEQRRKI